jgi:hypothetical protein
MIYLLLSILSSASIYLVFSLFGKYKVNLLPAITINYLVAALAGLIHNQSTNDIYYVKKLVKEGSEKTSTLELVAVGQDGGISAAAQVVLDW